MIDYYIVRIYRREKDDPDSIVGTIEQANSSERKAFRCSDELWSILGGFGESKRRDKGHGSTCDSETR